MSRDGNGELAGEIEDVSAADAGPGPATEIVPDGLFGSVFGSIEGRQMLLVDALNFIVDDGIEAARHDYASRVTR